jgi:hypothetical protein
MGIRRTCHRRDCAPAAGSLPSPQRSAWLGPLPAAAQTPSLPPTEEAPLNEQIERLLATHKAEDAYRAYWLVADCAAFNLNGDRIVFDQEELKHPKPGALPGFRGMSEEEKRHDARLCSGMSERQRQSRLDYLAIAAKAGVFGAALNFANEGPFGDPSALQTRPGDPLVQEWRATARAQLTQAAEAGTDLSAIQYLAQAHADGAVLGAKDPLLAYRYFAAWDLIEEDLLGPAHPLVKNLARIREQRSGMLNDASPEQRAAELAAARRIADLAKMRREQANKSAPGG